MDDKDKREAEEQGIKKSKEEAMIEAAKQISNMAIKNLGGAVGDKKKTTMMEN